MSGGFAYLSLSELIGKSISDQVIQSFQQSFGLTISQSIDLPIILPINKLKQLCYSLVFHLL